MSGTVKIEAQRMDAWVGFMHAHALIMKKLSDDLDAAGQIPIGTYDVLVQLSEAGGALRHRDLLERLVMSQPGLSRKVERLESAALVERRPDPDDGRGVIVKLTRAGRAALRSAAKVHMAGVDREFAQRLTDHEAAVMAVVFRRLLETDQRYQQPLVPVHESSDDGAAEPSA